MFGHTRDTGGRALLKAPFNRELLRSVRSTDGEGALPDRGSLASGSRFLLITMNVIIDSVDTPPPEEESYLSLGSILFKHARYLFPDHTVCFRSRTSSISAARPAE
jgi:hypothetical protein